jgi:hypothetical protein
MCHQEELRVGGNEKTDDEKKRSQKRRDHETFVKSRTQRCRINAREIWKEKIK